MAKRWINSMDVEVGANGAPLFDVAGCSSFVGGTKTVSSTTTPQALVSTLTPCRFVWIGARVNSDGNPLNTKPCFIGNSSNQNIPILPSNFEGVVIHIDDASKVFVKVGVANQGIVYRIFA